MRKEKDGLADFGRWGKVLAQMRHFPFIKSVQ
jgi:hypothetical protein